MLSNVYVLGTGAAIGLVVLWVLIAMMFRVVVPTNEVHIVQRQGTTVSYGRVEGSAGNSYYKWPSWIPRIGVLVSKLPTSVFSIKLEEYEAYDKARLPFMIDIMAFFRISDSNLAAQRVETREQLQRQLEGILQGACRTILATNEIEQILEGRSQFGEQFTKEVDGNLREWGVGTVKSIELMQIKDSPGSKIIANIMAKKSSLIDRESRIEVAANKRASEIAEIEGQQAVKERDQESQRIVGQRTAEKEQAVGIAQEQSKQAVRAQAKITMEREMDVSQVQTVRQAEITKASVVIAATQAKETDIIKAEGEKQKRVIGAEGQKQEQVLRAEGTLITQLKNAEGIEAEGKAKGAAETALLMAPVDSQIKLAEKIGSDQGYQKYLIEIRGVEATEAVGIEQAKAMAGSEIKIIATGNGIGGGIKSAAGLMSPDGGATLGGMIEAFMASDAGAALLRKFGIKV